MSRRLRSRGQAEGAGVAPAFHSAGDYSKALGKRTFYETIDLDLEAAYAHRQQRTGVTPERVLRDIDTAANLDIADLFDEQKRLKSIHDMPLHVRRAIVSVDMLTP